VPAFDVALTDTGVGHAIISGWAVVTVTANEQFAEFDEASVAVQVTVVTPTGKVEPDAGEQFTTTVPLQLSEADGAGKVTTAELCPATAPMVTGAGHTMVGGVASPTVTLNTHVRPL
jgi:hypothetical protein